MDQSQGPANVKNELTDSILRRRLQMLKEKPKSSYEQDDDYLAHSEFDIKTEAHEYESEFQAIAGTSYEICPNYDVKTETDESMVKIEYDNLDISVQDPLAINHETKVADSNKEQDFQEELGNEKIAEVNIQKNGKPEYWLTRYNKQIDLEIKKKSITCSVCHKMFINTRHLKIHMGVHYGKTPHECSTCGQSFSSKAGLSRHKSNSHTDKKAYVCDVCNKEFELNVHLMGHKLIHSDVRMFTCNVCDEKFLEKYELNKHKLIHTDKKLPTCNICSKQFRHERFLTKHMRSHTDETPYPCDLCDRAYKQKSHLLRHKKSFHAKEKQHICHICNKSYARNISLVQHLRTFKH